MANGANFTATVQVPAWKRLGLKLRSEEDAAVDSSSTLVSSPQPDEDGNSGPKRQRETLSEKKPGKRRKIGADDELETRYSSGRDHKSPKIPDDKPSGNREDKTGTSVKTPKRIVFDSEASHDTNRRKSVTFTPDTKTEDGFSSARLYDAWSASHGDEIDNDIPPSAPDSPPSTPSKQSSKKPKPPKPSSSKNPTASRRSHPPSSDHKPAFTSYLEQFHHDRTNWKFNKNKQTDLLRNLFSTTQLPPSFTPAILAYVSGLQGASARQRLHEQAIEILEAIASKPENQPPPEEDHLPMNTSEGRAAAAAAALQRQIDRYAASGAGRCAAADEQLEELRVQNERGERAMALLREALSEFLYPERKGVEGKREGAGDREGGNGGLVVQEKKKRSRKSRTEVEDDDSEEEEESSSEDSSSSSSESDSSSSESSSGDGSSSESSSDDEDAKEESGGGKLVGEGGKSKPKPKPKPFFDEKLLDLKFGKRPK